MSVTGDPLPHICVPNTGGQSCWICGANLRPNDAAPADAAPPPDAEAEVRRLLDGMEAAWGIIANAHGGIWENAEPHWQEAAERWRDQQWHPALDRLRGTNWFSYRVEPFQGAPGGRADSGTVACGDFEDVVQREIGRVAADGSESMFAVRAIIIAHLRALRGRADADVGLDLEPIRKLVREWSAKEAETPEFFAEYSDTERAWQHGLMAGYGHCAQALRRALGAPRTTEET